MKTPAECLQCWKQQIKKQWKLAFLTAFLVGLLVHLPMMLSDIPNHDGLDSMYFDQNMITSGRWFLMIACGFSSYFTLPWIIGLIGLLWLGVTAAFLVEFLECKDGISVVLISGLLAVFPALASTFAYVFTLDGYMLALLFAVAAPLCVKKWKFGFIPGALCLALSLGTYQAYLPFAVILSIYGILMLAMEDGTLQKKLQKVGSYLLMGVAGLALYYLLLQVLLKLQGKVLDTYQGIQSMVSAGGTEAGTSPVELVKTMYLDFLAFTVKGNVWINNLWSLLGVILLFGAVLLVLLPMIGRKKWWKKPLFWLLMGLSALGLPIACNLILVISPDVTYHLLMRYHWVLLLILPIAFVGRSVTSEDKKVSRSDSLGLWALLLAGVLLIGNYAVTDNIAYANLQKRYEKTYAYCIRLLDRIEQTPGYYQGIPIAMIGVVGEDSYPSTDLTGEVTANMIGMTGDVLLYTGDNYASFIRHYLGASLNILPAEVMSEIYYSESYRELDSFPGENSTKVVDGVLYVKTENIDRTEGK